MAARGFEVSTHLVEVWLLGFAKRRETGKE
jgi:hypothetical protein